VTHNPRAAEPSRGNPDRQIIVDTIPAQVWIAAPDGAITFVNQQRLDYTGQTLDEALGWGWTNVFHPADLPALIETWRHSLAAGQPIEAEARVRRLDGTYRWFLIRAVPLRDGDGTVLEWYGTNTDIDDRKRAEQELRRSESYLAEAQTLSGSGSFGWKVSTGELFWSKETFSILEYDTNITPSLDLL
jgi:PAS domain S-box-containing protein